MVDTDFLTHTLKNGIRIIHQHTDSPVGHLGIMINAGSRDEEEDEHGLSHFIEHSVFKGTEKRKSFHILSRIEGVGGELNAYTTKEETVLYSTFIASRLVSLDLIESCFNRSDRATNVRSRLKVCVFLSRTMQFPALSFQDLPQLHGMFLHFYRAVRPGF